MTTPPRPPQGQRPGAQQVRRPAPQPRQQYLVPLAASEGRIKWLVVGFLIIFSVISARLVDLQIVQGPKLQADSNASFRREIAVPALRGNITDVNGVPLATTVMAKHITVDQTLIKNPRKYAELIGPLVGKKPAELIKSLTGTKRFAYVVKSVTPEQWNKVNDLDLIGIYSESVTKRTYPADTLASNIVGVVGGEGKGLFGIEQSMNHELSGTDGKYSVDIVNEHEIPATMSNVVDATDGQSVRLTIDQDIQALAERVLKDRLKTAGAKGGDVIVIRPQTGEILAMASAPNFNPNDTKKLKPKMLHNAAAEDAFEPGSTSKVMTMAAVIEEGAYNVNSKFVVKGGITRGGTTFHDHDPHGTLHLTLNGILAKSSNIGSIMAAEKIGKKRFMKYLQKFGVGQKTHVGLSGETPGILPPMEKWSDTTFPTLAFGQGLAVSAVQMASIYATIANDGVRVQPHLIAGTTDANGNYTPNEDIKSTRIVSVKTARTVREMLESVVSADGTAPGAQIPGYRVAGKTGTAQKATANGYSGFTASFVGLAPADNPQLVIAVMIHNPVNGHFGSLISGPVFRDVMTYALAKEKVAPSKSKRPSIPVEW